MTIDPDFLLNMPPIVERQTLTKKDTILYALGVGAGADGGDLDFVYEKNLKALPTMALVLGYPGFIWQYPELGADWKRVLHGEQAIELHGPLPVEGEIIGETRITDVFDKGVEKGAIVIAERVIRDAAGTLLATMSGTMMMRGDGGCGGSTDAPPKPHPIPEDRAADHVVAMPTAKNQAMIYRLSGDMNPLHIDPEVASAGGFDAPILQGLGTCGVVGRSLLGALMDNDPVRMKRLSLRFSRPFFPGETIRTEIWNEDNGRAAFRAFSAERDVMVINNGLVEFT